METFIQEFISSVDRRFSSLTSLLGLQNCISDVGYRQVPIIEGHSRSSQHDSYLVLFFLPLESEEEIRTELEGINHDEDKGRKWEKVHEFLSGIQKSEWVSASYLTFQKTRF